MSAKGLARFDTRTRTRTAQTDERSQQTDFRTISAREHGQLALDEVESGAVRSENRASFDARIAIDEPARGDLEVALECARATIDGLREQIEELEAERDRHRRKLETRTER